jgi:hypothetical protein
LYSNVRNGRSKKQIATSAGFLLGLFFDTEDGGNMFIRKDGWLSTAYTALHAGHRALQ